MTSTADRGAFRHEALLYAGEDDFLRATVPFVADGVAADEPVLVVVNRHKIALLRDHLGGTAQAVQFADMSDLGRNPARIIPAWHAFLEEHAAEGRPVRGIGEPISSRRSPAELVECQRHESLLNVAFNGVWPFRLLCPYDVSELGDDVLHEARRSHPYLHRDGVDLDSAEHVLADMAGDHLDDPLPAPPEDAVTFSFGADDLPGVRDAVRSALARTSIQPERLSDLLLAVNELTTNSIRHGGGAGVLRVWTERGDAVVEVRDRGQLHDPLAGRRQPALTSQGGRGLWMVNHLCDLVQVRSRADHLVVRARSGISR